MPGLKATLETSIVIVLEWDRSGSARHQEVLQVILMDNQV